MPDNVIPLAPDQTETEMQGLPKPLTPEGDVTIENPAMPVNLKDYKLVDGVPEGGPDDPNPTNIDVYPPIKGASESE